MNENLSKSDRDKPLPLTLVSEKYKDDGVIFDMAKCPNCGRTIDLYYEEHYKYCPTCGQRLDWSYIDDD